MTYEWKGEAGPELMVFRGGERVIGTAQAKAAVDALARAVDHVKHKTVRVTTIIRATPPEPDADS